MRDVAHTEATRSPANILCQAAESVTFARCRFTRLGGAGIDLVEGARNNAIRRCEFRDISGSAVQIGDVGRQDHHPDDPRRIVRNNAVTDCVIREVAAEYKGGVGIFAGYTDGTVIAHNAISDLPYTAVSVGWGWGEVDAGGGAYVHPAVFDMPTPCANNRIEGNHVHHVMQELDDGGAIYTLGEMPGTVIRGNYVHDVGAAEGLAIGIYLDEGSGHIEVAGNAVHDAARVTHFNNGAQDRLATCRIHDNVWDRKPGEPGFPEEIAARAGPRPDPPDGAVSAGRSLPRTFTTGAGKDVNRRQRRKRRSCAMGPRPRPHGA